MVQQRPHRRLALLAVRAAQQHVPVLRLERHDRPLHPIKHDAGAH
jgi:hypothetical protein